MTEDNIKFIEPQHINISDVELSGRILDIGGGGEGIIGLLKGERVVAIDRRESELKEAPPGDYLKIVMDAKELKFIDENHQIIFQEIHRVLKKGGEFVIWDFPIPKRDKHEKEFYGLMLEVKIRDTNISTGYATKWVKEQDLEYYTNLGTSNGFSVVEKYPIDGMFYIRFKKD